MPSAIKIALNFLATENEPTEKVKYPRTPHLPWSPGATSDDKMLKNIGHFLEMDIVATEKMDGENTTITFDYTHARSLDSVDHPSRHWLKSMWMKKRFDLPKGLRIHGENLYAKHSIKYEELPSYFIVFAVSEGENFLCWDETVEWCQLLDLHHAPILYRGKFDEKLIKDIYSGKSKFGGSQEGYVIRNIKSFPINKFGENVAKFVRTGHVQTDQHWMTQKIKVNKLKVDVPGELNAQP